MVQATFNQHRMNPNEDIIVTVDEDLADIVPGFLANKQKDILKIQDALQCNDYDTIRLLGHSMKGAGGGYGFDRITDIGKSIEEAAKLKNVEAIKKYTNSLSAFLCKVKVIYAELE